MVADNMSLFNMSPDEESKADIEAKVSTLKENKAIVDEKWAKMQVCGKYHHNWHPALPHMCIERLSLSMAAGNLPQTR